jgi:hypothetical protein
MGYETAGRLLPISRGVWNAEYEYDVLDSVTYEDKTYIARKPSLNIPPTTGGEDDEYWMLLIEPYLEDMVGATAEEDGQNGLATQPLAGDQDSVLLGDGTYSRRLQTSILRNDVASEVIGDGSDDDDGVVSTFGYENESGELIPFITYDEVIKKSMIGDAEPEDVLLGKTFSNKNERGLSGTMKNYSVGTNALAVYNGTDATRPAFRQTTLSGVTYYQVTMPTGFWKYSYNDSSVLLPTEEKTVQATTNNITVTPSSGKVLTKVTIKGATIPSVTTQTKTVTASRSQQIVKPDSGKYLSQVTVNKYPDATGTYKPTANSSAADMGTTNNYRYVNTTAVYDLGYNAGMAKGKTDALVVGTKISTRDVGSGISVTANKYYLVLVYGTHSWRGSDNDWSTDNVTLSGCQTISIIAGGLVRSTNIFNQTERFAKTFIVKATSTKITCNYGEHMIAKLLKNI